MSNNKQQPSEKECPTDSKLDDSKYGIRSFEANVNQLHIIVDIYAKMQLPICVTISLYDFEEGKYTVSASYPVVHKLLVDWFFEEVLRQEAKRNKYLSTDL